MTKAERLRAMIAIARKFFTEQIRQPIGRLLVALGILQLFLVVVIELIDVFDDIVLPLVDEIICDEEV